MPSPFDPDPDRRVRQQIERTPAAKARTPRRSRARPRRAPRSSAADPLSGSLLPHDEREAPQELRGGRPVHVREGAQPENLRPSAGWRSSAGGSHPRGPPIACSRPACLAPVVQWRHTTAPPTIRKGTSPFPSASKMDSRSEIQRRQREQRTSPPSSHHANGSGPGMSPSARDYSRIRFVRA
jgi:hypothetical protein